MPANPPPARNPRLPSWYQAKHVTRGVIRPIVTQDPTLKRKATPQNSNEEMAAKRPKRSHEGHEITHRNEGTPKKKLTDEDFRVTSTWGQVDPIGITTAQLPLTTFEARRLWEWSWSRSWGGEKISSCSESPGGMSYA